MNIEDNGATFSECGKYRYVLWRVWDDSKPKVMFIGLNPSTANAVTDDNTIKKVKKIAGNWGCGGIYMMNLFAFVTPHPDELNIVEHPFDNYDNWLMEVNRITDRVVFAWGNFKVDGRDKKVREMFPYAYALHLNKNGSPKHPLYCKDDTIPFLI